jgi:peptide/nickel transport system substrate-binding protein
MSTTPLDSATVRPADPRPRGRRRLGAALAAACVLSLVCIASTPAFADGASPSSPAASLSNPADAKTFTLGITADVDSLNPYSGYLAISYEVYNDVYDLLQGWSQKDYSPTPALAESWTHSDDGLTWTFKIRQGVRWSDGQPVAASDVAYTFNRAINDDAANAQYYNYVKNIKSVEAPDPATAVFHLSAPDPIMDQLWVPILPEHIWKDVSKNDSATFKNSEMIGSGPFQMVQRVTGQYIKLKANKNYWGGAPKIDYLVYRVYNDQDAMIQALRKGDIDAVNEISPAAYNSLADAKNIARIRATDTRIAELGFNTGAATVDNQPVGDGAPAARDPKFRQAIAHAIDLKTLTDKVWQGYATPGRSIIPPAYTRWSYDPGPNAYTYDPAKAQQMLDAAGYTKGAGGYRIDPATSKVMNLRFYGPNDTEAYKSDIQYVQAYLDAVGIKSTIKSVSQDKLTDIIANGEADIYIWGWGVEPDPSFELSVMTCDQRDTGTSKHPISGWSDSFYCNPAYDALFKQQGQQLDPTQRAATVQQMQQMLYTEAPYIVLHYADNLEAYNGDKWTGIQIQPEHGGNAFFQMGTYTYRSIDHKSNATSNGGGISASVWIVGGVIVLVIVVIVLLATLRRRATVDDRE